MQFGMLVTATVADLDKAPDAKAAVDNLAATARLRVRPVRGRMVIELPAGATPVDFAYALHTSVGHRCRGARVDGALLQVHDDGPAQGPCVVLTHSIMTDARIVKCLMWTNWMPITRRCLMAVSM